MAILNFDLSNEANQIKEMLSVVVREDLQPVIKESIQDAEEAISRVINQSSNQLDEKIDKIADELHNQRKITKQEIEEIINYASSKFSAAIDERVASFSELVDSKAKQLRGELESAAVRSRTQLWMNASVAIGTSVFIALVALLYRKLSDNEIDLFTTFRIIFMSMTLGSFALLVVKLWRRYKKLDTHSKNLIQVLSGYAGMLRPNGAVGLFALTLALALIWALLQVYHTPLQKLISP